MFKPLLSWLALRPKVATSSPKRPRNAVGRQFEQLESRATPARFTVDSLADTVDPNDQVRTLREAFNEVNASQDAGNIIDFAKGLSGTVQLQSSLPTLQKNVDITGPGITVSGNDSFRLMSVAANTTVSVTQLSLTGGDAVGGGAIDNFGTLTLSGCSLYDNSAGAGGALYNNDGATLHVASCLLFDNTASQHGGAIENAGNLLVDGSEIHNNSTAGDGGGIWNADFAVASVIASSIYSNQATFYGGGFFNSARGQAAFSGSTTIFSNFADFGGGIASSKVLDDHDGRLSIQGGTQIFGNDATFFGGGIANYSNNLSVEDASVNSNDAGLDGGGIYVDETIATCTITRSAISQNTSGTSGGGINTAAPTTITDSIINQNTAVVSGGGVHVHIHLTEVTDCTLLDNSAPVASGSAIFWFATNGAQLNVSGLNVNGTIVAG